MAKFKIGKQAPQPPEDAGIKSFLDMIAPSVVKFNTDHFICGNTYRCVWALREYPTSTDEQAILRHLGEKDGVTLRIYTRQVTASEEKQIIQNASNKNRMNRSNTNDIQQTVTAESNLQDVVTLVNTMHRNKEPLLHCAVYIELTANDYDALKLLQTDILTELVRSKLNVDRLTLRQQEGFRCVGPSGHNVFGAQFERVLPASSVANLYPFNYSGKTDAKGFYIGKDKYGSNVLVDFDQRDEDKTSANILILGNSGQGKSYLMKLLILNLLEAGKSIITLDVEHEQREMCEAVGGCFADLMAGQYRINILEPKCWDDGGDPDDTEAPEAFRKSTRLAQHISFLKDFFRAYKDFTDAHIDTIEIMVSKLYEKWGITDRTNFARMRPEEYPILSDLYELIEAEYQEYDQSQNQLYTKSLLQEILLGLHSMCKGADAQFFNGHTNITSSRFLVFGVKGLLSAAKNVRNAMLLEKQKPSQYIEYRLGKLYASGSGTEQDHTIAAKWFAMAAEKKHKYAQYSLAGQYLRGQGVEQDSGKAYRLYAASAAQGFPYAAFELGKLLRDGKGCSQNSGESERWFRQAYAGFVSLEQQSHDDKLQYRLGWMHLHGIGTEKNESEARKWFEKSARLDNPHAQYQLAKLILADATAKPEQIAQAVEWLTQSAEAGQDCAQYVLGKLYRDGKAVAKDIARAVEWFRKAAEQDNSYAAYALGKLCLDGTELPKDVATAVKWLTHSASLGNQFAQYRLGKLYLTGADVPKDIPKALEYLTASAEGGNQYAQYTLGKLYLLGKDIPKDREKAVDYLTRSAAQGNEYAQFFLDRLEQFRDPSIGLAVLRMLRHMSRIFTDNATTGSAGYGMQIDRKRRKKLREKKIAAGHKPDDQEQQNQHRM